MSASPCPGRRARGSRDGTAPVTASIGVRVLIVFGMVLGVTAVGSLFAVAGAAAGAAVGALLKVVPAEKKAEGKAKA